MDINFVPVTGNKVQLMSPAGFPSPVTITRAWNFTAAPTEDIYLKDKSSNRIIPFIIIPIATGAISVGLAGDEGTPYLISAEEVAANKGLPMIYLVTRIYSSGTTLSSFNIGI